MFQEEIKDCLIKHAEQEQKDSIKKHNYMVDTKLTEVGHFILERFNKEKWVNLTQICKCWNEETGRSQGKMKVSDNSDSSGDTEKDEVIKDNLNKDSKETEGKERNIDAKGDDTSKTEEKDDNVKKEVNDGVDKDDDSKTDKTDDELEKSNSSLSGETVKKDEKQDKMVNPLDPVKGKTLKLEEMRIVVRYLQRKVKNWI